MLAKGVAYTQSQGDEPLVKSLYQQVGDGRDGFGGGELTRQ